MKLMVVLGAISFTCGALMLIWNWVVDIYHYSVFELPVEIVFVAAFLMVIPVVALISWMIWKVIRKL
jgi:hypothetical protein